MIEDEKKLFYAQISIPIGEEKRTLIPCMAFDNDGARMIFEAWRHKAIRKYGLFSIINVFSNDSRKLREIRLGFKIRKTRVKNINRFLARNLKGPQNKLFHYHFKKFLRNRISTN